MQNCIIDIRLCKEHDKLLNDENTTEFLIVGTRQQLFKVNISSINMENLFLFYFISFTNR